MPSCQLKIRLQPRASKDEVIGRQGDEIKVRITAPPVEGAANKHLIKFISKRLGVKPSSVELTAGHKGRSKVLKIEGLTLAEAETALGVSD